LIAFTLLYDKSPKQNCYNPYPFHRLNKGQALQVAVAAFAGGLQGEATGAVGGDVNKKEEFARPRANSSFGQ
jgi:hypothetical protein